MIIYIVLTEGLVILGEEVVSSDMDRTSMARPMMITLSPIQGPQGEVQYAPNIEPYCPLIRVVDSKRDPIFSFNTTQITRSGKCTLKAEEAYNKAVAKYYSSITVPDQKQVSMVVGDKR